MPSPSSPVKPARSALTLRKKLTALGMALLVLLAAGSTWWLSRGAAAHKEAGEASRSSTGGETGEGAAASAEAVRVDVVKARPGGLMRETKQPGSVHAYESVDMFAKVSGFLKTQEVDIGAVVKRGDVLAVIDVPELEKDVEEAAAAVEQAKARAVLAEARVATAVAEQDAVAATVVQAEADIAQHVAKRSLSEKQLERIKGLLNLSAITKEVVDEHEQELESARASERSARAAALTARAQHTASAAKVQQAKADVAEAKTVIRSAEARLARARVITDYSRLTAPFDGVVTARYFFPGSFIRSAADGSAVPLLTIMRTDKVRVVVQVPDNDVALLDVGDPASVVIDALHGKKFAGTVSRLAHAENPTTRTMRVEVDVLNPTGLLCEGMYGRATIVLRPPTSNLSLPAGCVLGHSAGGQAKVYVVKDNHVAQAVVSVGADDGSNVEIVSGLGPDDQVVLRPQAIVDEEDPVVANLVPTVPPH